MMGVVIGSLRFADPGTVLLYSSTDSHTPVDSISGSAGLAGLRKSQSAGHSMRAIVES